MFAIVLPYIPKTTGQSGSLVTHRHMSFYASQGPAKTPPNFQEAPNAWGFATSQVLLVGFDPPYETDIIHNQDKYGVSL